MIHLLPWVVEAGESERFRPPLWNGVAPMNLRPLIAFVLLAAGLAGCGRHGADERPATTPLRANAAIARNE